MISNLQYKWKLCCHFFLYHNKYFNNKTPKHRDTVMFIEYHLHLMLIYILNKIKNMLNYVIDIEIEIEEILNIHVLYLEIIN